MAKEITEAQARSIVTKVAIELGVSPRLISTRLLDENDKQNMLSGEVTYDVLLLHTRLWMAAGMPDYAHGSTSYWKKQ